MEELEGSLLEMRDVLTDREQEVVSWTVQGMTNKEIAIQFGISEKTVKTHLQNAFRKLNAVDASSFCAFPVPRPLRPPCRRPAPSVGIAERELPDASAHWRGAPLGPSPVAMANPAATVTT
jgi:DNA-binding CsgD family transcriptional regulator